MKNLINQAVVLAKTNFKLADMDDDGTNLFFKLDQVQTKGSDFILVVIKDKATATASILGDVSIGADIMASGEAGKRTLLYKTDWDLTPSTDDGRIYAAAFIKDSSMVMDNLKTDYFDLPFDEYANLDADNNLIPE